MWCMFFVMLKCVYAALRGARRSADGSEEVQRQIDVWCIIPWACPVCIKAFI